MPTEAFAFWLFVSFYLYRRTDVRPFLFQENGLNGQTGKLWQPKVYVNTAAIPVITPAQWQSFRWTLMLLRKEASQAFLQFGDSCLTPHSDGVLMWMWASQPACSLILSVVAWGYEHQESCKKQAKDHRVPQYYANRHVSSTGCNRHWYKALLFLVCRVRCLLLCVCSIPIGIVFFIDLTVISLCRFGARVTSWV